MKYLVPIIHFLLQCNFYWLSRLNLNIFNWPQAPNILLHMYCVNHTLKHSLCNFFFSISLFYCFKQRDIFWLWLAKRNWQTLRSCCEVLSSNHLLLFRFSLKPKDLLEIGTQCYILIALYPPQSVQGWLVCGYRDTLALKRQNCVLCPHLEMFWCQWAE